MNANKLINFDYENQRGTRTDVIRESPSSQIDGRPRSWPAFPRWIIKTHTKTCGIVKRNWCWATCYCKCPCNRKDEVENKNCYIKPELELWLRGLYLYHRVGQYLLHFHWRPCEAIFTKWISIELQLSCCFKRDLRIFVMPYLGKLQMTRNKVVCTYMYKTKYNNWQKGDYFCLINDLLLQIPYWKGKCYVSYIQRRLIDHVNWDYWLLLHLIISGVRLYVLAGRALVWMIAAYGRLDLSLWMKKKGPVWPMTKATKAPKSSI